MNGRTTKAVADKAAAGGETGGATAPQKEEVFSIKSIIRNIIKKAVEEGITDGRRWLWIDFTPHIVVVRREDGYMVVLWREGVAVKIYLDEEFNVVGFDVEVRP
jgi:hypothetical protein